MNLKAINNCFLVICLIVFGSISLTYGQEIYFVKYKNSGSFTESVTKVKELFSKSIGDAPVNSTQYSIKSCFEDLNSKRDLSELAGIVKIESAGEIPSTILSELTNNPSIEYVHKGTTFSINAQPNDSLFTKQWSFSRMNVLTAWDVTQGVDSVIISVIDTGIDYLHPDLNGSLFLNNGEIGTDILGRDKRENGVDDDLNGLIDDWRGYDFTDRVGIPSGGSWGDFRTWDNDPMDENGFSHGTSCAGIIAAQVNNSIGIAGIAPKVKVLNVRAFDPEGYGDEEDVAAAVLYSVAMGAKVISMSFGDYTYSYVLRDVLRYAHSRGVVLIASSGNSNSANPHYPSGFTEVISVGNSTENDYVAGSSNYGSSLDIVAPGSAIFTTQRNSKYGLFNGTSAAAPHIAAVAGLLLSVTNSNNEEIRQILKTSADDIESVGWDERSGAGRVNAGKALTVLSPSLLGFLSPKQDAAFVSEDVFIVANVSSPFFENYSLYYGLGLNPTTWLTLSTNSEYQVLQDTIGVIRNNTLKDTVYTIRLVVNQKNGRTLEERVSFSKASKNVELTLTSALQAHFGDKNVIAASVVTSAPATVKMYYKEQSSTKYSEIFLDGFAQNNKFVKQEHFGITPIEQGLSSGTYNIYFEAVNEAGLKSFIAQDTNITIKIGDDKQFRDYSNLGTSLPAGAIYEKSYKSSSGAYWVFFRSLTQPDSTLVLTYSSITGSFTRVASVFQAIIKDIGDFNNNGKTDVLALWGYRTKIFEIDEQSSAKLSLKYDSQNAYLWPTGVKDIDSDGDNELLAFSSENTLGVYSISSNFTLSLVKSLTNPTPSANNGNVYNSATAVVTNTDGDAKNEIWLIDLSGDIISYDVNSISEIAPKYLIATDFESSSSYISSGDYNGDSKSDIGVILRSVEDIDLIPFYRAVVFNVNPANGTPIFYFDRAFVNATAGFTVNRGSSSIAIKDFNNDGINEVALSLFPHLYSFEYNSGNNSNVLYLQNSSNSSLFSDRLFSNSPNYLAVSNNDSTYFIQFHNGKTSVHNLVGYSLNSSKLSLKWDSNPGKFYIFRYEKGNAITLIDSINGNSYTDSSVVLEKEYTYSVNELPIYGNQSSITVFHHIPATIKSITFTEPRALRLLFNGPVSSSVSSLQTVKIKRLSDNKQYAVSSISPYTENSYLVTLNEDLVNGDYSCSLDVGLSDRYGSPVVPQTVNFTVVRTVQTDPFFISNVSINDPYTFTITFNTIVDSASALNYLNYRFTPENTISKISFGSERNILILSTKGKGNPISNNGVLTKVELSNIFSQNGTPITIGTGSSFVLTGFSENLSEVYVYPNPGKIGETVTFAGLPKNSSITLISLSGEVLETFEENDGDGGYIWDTRIKGEYLPSGIYFFRIALLNASGSETDDILKKFVLVR